MITSTLIAAFIGGIVAVQAVPLGALQASLWPDQEPCWGNCTGIHDPSLIHAPDGTWWLFSTNGDISIASAPDITGPWTYQGPMLPNGIVIHAVPNQELWAPDVSFIDGSYYAYYSASTSGSQQSDIGVATATDPSGNWTDHGSIGIPIDSKYNRIDPNLFRQVNNNTIYLSLGSSWYGVFQTTMDDSFLTITSGATQTNLVYNSTIPTGGQSAAIVEGSFQFSYTVGSSTYYYLFFSSGACCNAASALAAPGDEYKVMVCRSDTPTGPFFDAKGSNCLTENGGTLVLGSHGSNVYAPGGQGVYQDAGLKAPVLYYHYVNPNIGFEFSQFQFGFNYLDFSSGWPVVTS